LSTVKSRWQTIVISHLRKKRVASRDEIWNYLCDHLRPPLRPTIRQFHHFLTTTKEIKPLGKSTIREGTYRYEDNSQII